MNMHSHMYEMIHRIHGVPLLVRSSRAGPIAEIYTMNEPISYRCVYSLMLGVKYGESLSHEKHMDPSRRREEIPERVEGVQEVSARYVSLRYGDRHDIILKIKHPSMRWRD